MQLSFDAADRLVELVQARHGPVARGRGGPRAVRARARPGRARPLAPRRRRRRRRAALLHRDARRPRGRSARGRAARGRGARRLRPRDDRALREDLPHLRDRGRARARARGRRHVRDARRPGHRAAGPRRRADRDPAGGPAAAPRIELALRRFLEFAGDVPLVAHNARFDVSLPRPGGRGADGPPLRRARPRHRLARAAPARAAGASASPCGSSRTSSASPSSRATARFPTRSRPPRSSSRSWASRRSAVPATVGDLV